MESTVSINVKKFWQSSNFWTSIVLAIGGLWAGFSPEMGTELVAGLFGVVASGKAAHNFFKNEGVFDKTQLWSVNFWSYLSVAITTLVPIALPDELFTGIRELIGAIAEGNWSAVLTAIFTLATTIYYLVKDNKGSKVPTK